MKAWKVLQGVEKPVEKPKVVEKVEKKVEKVCGWLPARDLGLDSSLIALKWLWRENKLLEDGASCSLCSKWDSEWMLCVAM